MENIVNKILDKMKEIEYGWVDKNGVIHKNCSRKFFLENYRFQTIEETLQFKVGTCWEQTELIRYYCDIEAIPVDTYIIIYNDEEKIARHTIAVIKDMDKDYYWVESSWKKLGRNIKFNSLGEIFETIIDIFPKIYKINEFDKNKIEIYKYKKPRYGISYYEFSEYCRKQEKIDLEKMLLEKLNEFYIYSNKNFYVDEITEKEDYTLVHSYYVKDPDCNFAININSKSNFKEIENNVIKDMKSIDSNSCFIVSPISEIYDSRDEIFDKNKYTIGKEAWFIYDDFSEITNLKTSSNIKLEKSTDMKLLADVTYKAFRTGDKEDPYSDLDQGYFKIYENYKGTKGTNYNRDFYLIKYEDEIVGIVVTVYDDKIFGIYGFAIFKDFRGKGIGKEVINKLLKKCNKKNLKIAFLQTEDDFYPAKFYEKAGFKKVGIAYYYELKK